MKYALVPGVSFRDEVKDGWLRTFRHERARDDLEARAWSRWRAWVAALTPEERAVARVWGRVPGGEPLDEYLERLRAAGEQRAEPR